MAYNKKTWVSKETITKEALNNIENGIANLDTTIENLIGSISLGVHTDGAVYVFIDGQPVGSGIILNDLLGTTDGFIDENNNIFLPDNFISGTYTLKYENEDGTYTTIGQFDIPDEEDK